MIYNYCRYFTCNPDIISKVWEDRLMLYQSNPGFISMSNNLCSLRSANPFLEEQFFMLSDLPNHHKWKWCDLVMNLRFEQKLSTSCRYFPGSPRNRIIQACCYQDNVFTIVHACLNNVFCVKEPVIYSEKRKKRESIKAKRSNKRKKLSLKDILAINVSILMSC